MKGSLNLKWSDIRSETMNIQDFFEKFKDKLEIKKNFDEYKPKEKILKKINKILNKTGKKLKILVIGAEWCPDCTEQIPRMAQIIQNFKFDIEMRILYGIKVNPFRKKGDILWDKKHSVPEAVDPKFNVKAIPIIYFFKEDGDYLGRIVETPKTLSSLEKDFYHIIKKRLTL